jgi:hypothetical protein
MSSIRVLDDERVDELMRMIRTVWKKQDITIKMLTKIGRILEEK